MASTSRVAPLKDPQINDIDRNFNNEPGAMSDLDSSYYESDMEQVTVRSRQQTPETNLSGNW